MNRFVSQPATVRGTARPVLAGFTGLIAASAYAGAAALATGASDLGSAIEARFPFGSPVFAAAALLLVVAVPMMVTTHHAATGGFHAAGVAVLLAGLARRARRSGEGSAHDRHC